MRASCFVVGSRSTLRRCGPSDLLSNNWSASVPMSRPYPTTSAIMIAASKCQGAMLLQPCNRATVVRLVGERPSSPLMKARPEQSPKLQTEYIYMGTGGLLPRTILTV